jgi:predicted O-methyltransferase YrrM
MKLNNFITKYQNVTTHKKIKKLIKDTFIKNNLKKIKILEFGVDKGISTSLFLRYCERTNSKLFSIDIIDYSKLFKNMKWKFLQSRDDNKDNINKFLNSSVDIIFLDTEHTAKHVEKILYMYFDKLKIDGLFIIDDISWLPYIKNEWRDNEWIENNNKETFNKLIEIYNSNQKNIEITFQFEHSGLAIIKKKGLRLKEYTPIKSRKYNIKNILRNLFL